MNRPKWLGVTLVGLALCLAWGGPPTASADEETHNALIGKPAPPLKADFALNTAGKTVPQLAAYKGKVVLLTFWSMWRPTSRNAMLDLQNWRKEFQDKGLEVVAVTLYPSEFGHPLRFNPETDKVTKVKDSTAANDRKQVRAFATAHGLPFPLLMLPEAEAHRVLKVYGVASQPQFVVIDRKGVVRLIRVGTKPPALNAVEEEIKTLLDIQK